MNMNSFLNLQVKLEESAFYFMFGDKTYQLLGTVNFVLPTPYTIDDIRVELDVVDVDVPPLIGLKFLDKQ